MGEFVGRREIDELIKQVATRNAELTSLTLSPSDYDALMADLSPQVRYPESESSVLRYKEVSIYKRTCIGCCRHG